MKESQLHQAFSHWLNERGIPFIHSRTDQRTSTAKGDPDYCVCFMQHCLFLELKVGKNQLSPDQEKRIAYLRKAGNKVLVARTIEQCIEACHDILCLTGRATEAPASLAEPIREHVEAIGKDDGLNPRPGLFIGRIGPVPYVFEGSGAAGTGATMLRKATAMDLISIAQANGLFAEC